MLADHMPPISVTPMKTTALMSIPVVGVKISGIRAARIMPPATYCMLMTTSCTMIWQMMPIIMLFLS